MSLTSFEFDWSMIRWQHNITLLAFFYLCSSVIDQFWIWLVDDTMGTQYNTAYLFFISVLVSLTSFEFDWSMIRWEHNITLLVFFYLCSSVIYQFWIWLVDDTMGTQYNTTYLFFISVLVSLTSFEFNWSMIRWEHNITLLIFFLSLF